MNIATLTAAGIICTSFLAATDEQHSYWVTARHCTPTVTECTIDGKPATLIDRGGSRLPTDDWAVWKTEKRPDHQPLPLRATGKTTLIWEDGHKKKGESGSPMFDQTGHVIAILTLTSRDSHCGPPIDKVLPLLPQPAPTLAPEKPAASNEKIPPSDAESTDSHERNTEDSPPAKTLGWWDWLMSWF